ncbi:hypothetical protein ACOMHN_014510 [Nucella lapillus]
MALEVLEAVSLGGGGGVILPRCERLPLVLKELSDSYIILIEPVLMTSLLGAECRLGCLLHRCAELGPLLSRASSEGSVGGQPVIQAGHEAVMKVWVFQFICVERRPFEFGLFLVVGGDV